MPKLKRTNSPNPSYEEGPHLVCGYNWFMIYHFLLRKVLSQTMNKSDKNNCKKFANAVTYGGLPWKNARVTERNPS